MKEPGHREATIIVNGTKLSMPQSMAFRVAVAHMLMDMQDPLVLGADEHGRFMTKAYRKRLEQLQALVFKNL